MQRTSLHILRHPNFKGNDSKKERAQQMTASVREVDFSGTPKQNMKVDGRTWEPGTHRGCKFVEDLHFHVQKPGGKAKMGERETVVTETGD